MKNTNKLFYLILFVLAIAVNFGGINVRFFTDDPGLYASIAKNLIFKNTFTQLYTYNTDWLDKPHFPFWAVWVSFKIFGISTWAYKLPALLFFLMSLAYTWLFTRKYYNSETAAVAVLIAATAQHVLLSNTDVRAEPYLMGLIVGSIYHVASLHERYQLKHLLLAALLTACAVMTKGIFVVAAIYGGLLGQVFFKGEWRSLVSLKWIAVILLTLLFTLPEFYALYVQFDLHPEKTVFGVQHVSGIRWFLWDSQFGRFINTGPINRKASGSVFFFLHTLLWAFAPWCLLLYYAIFKNIKWIFRHRPLPEYYALSGGLLLLTLFSLSGFQLPFYTNAIFPLFAVITAPFCLAQLDKTGTFIRSAGFWLFIVLLPLLILIINYFLKPATQVFLIADCLLFLLLFLLIWKKIKEPSVKLVMLSCASALFAGFYLNTTFYNELIQYRGQIAAADNLDQKPFKGVHIYTLKAENNIFQFYCNKPVDLMPIMQFETFKPKTASIFYASQASVDYLQKNKVSFKVIRAFINYPQENLLPAFINKATRPTVLDHVYLISK